MKRFTTVICSCVAVSTLLFVGCGNSKNSDKDTTHGWRKDMARVQLPGNLAYEILKEGSGAVAQKGKVVTVHYTGWLDTDGQPGAKFDSSLDRGQPFQFPLGAGMVIKGWDEGVAGMKVGEKRRLFIPSELGYGARGAGRNIPPHANLIFDVELLQV